jgi:chemotaxis protein methyltransferase CheR
MSFTHDNDALLRLGELLKAETGISLGGLRPELVQARLSRRIHTLGMSDLAEYVTQLERGLKDEVQLFINLMTTNHTYFFRERPHLDFLASIFLPRFLANNPKRLTVWCAACSTGEEVYTVAMVIHRYLARQRSKLEVSVLGTDINTEALRIAANGVFPARRMQSVPQDFKREFFKQGKFPHDQYYRVADSIRSMVRFAPGNLLANVKIFQTFDLVFCRNVIIYFEQATAKNVVKTLRSSLSDEGILISGLSERIDHLDPRLELLGRSVHAGGPNSRYRHTAWECQPMEETIGDLSSKPRGSAETPTAARPLSVAPPIVNAQASPVAPLRTPNPVDVATQQRPTSLAATPALAPVENRKSTAQASSVAPLTRSSASQVVVAIGASTGGQEAVSQVISEFSTPFPPVVIAQHIAAGYSKAYVDAIARATTLQVKEAQDGENLQDDTIYVAPGGHHLSIGRRIGAKTLYAIVRPDDGSKLFVPSVNVLFSSLAALESIDVLAAVLTGMGDDGATGARELADRGCRVLAQDRATSTVYGMPGSAVATGAVAMELPIRAIGGVLASRVRQLTTRAGVA